MRYLLLMLRGFEGDLRFRRLGVLASEPDVQWPANFESSDRELDAIWNLCVRTQRIGTQDGQLDCPTREQAPYIGDGVLTARWFAQLTGDLGHYHNIIREQFRKQAPSGLIRSAIFGGSNDTLIDYSLLAVIALRDYTRFTGNTDAARQWAPTCLRIIKYFENLMDASGLVATNWTGTPPGLPWDPGFDAAQPSEECELGTNLFIDHPGLGWHNASEAGIDRRGTNCALNALLVHAYRALAEIEDLTDSNEANALRTKSHALASKIRDTFFDHDRGAFVDGVLSGQRLTQISEQTNTWAVMAGCLDDAAATALLRKLLESDDVTIARCGPYFWAYLYPELARLGLHELALRKTKQLWSKMLVGGATLLWETFLGDDLDSWCHPWSGAPLEFLLVHIAGLPDHNMDANKVILKPRFDLLDRCSASIMTRLGPFSIGWHRRGDSADLTATLPLGVYADLIGPEGQLIKAIRGEGKVSVTARTQQ